MQPTSRYRLRKHTKGQTDHIDAWLISYADLITLLFMLFVIFVSVSVSRQGHSLSLTHGEPEHPYVVERSGTLALGTPFDEAYRTLVGIVTSDDADQHIAVEKSNHGVSIDLSATYFFKSGSADIPQERLAVIKDIARTIKEQATGEYTIAVEGHTDDEAAASTSYSDNWELGAMRATHIVHLLIGEGLDGGRMHATSYAGNQPLVPNQDPAGRPIAENRDRNQRVVIRLERVEPPPSGY